MVFRYQDPAMRRAADRGDRSGIKVKKSTVGTSSNCAPTSITEAALFRTRQPDADRRLLQNPDNDQNNANQGKGREE